MGWLDVFVFRETLNPWIEVHNATHIRGGVGFAAFER